MRKWSLEHNFGKLARFIIDAIGWYVLVESEICEALENLLERRLTDTVVLELMFFFEFFDSLK